MSNTRINTAEEDNQTLFDELEKRYGGAVAQEIIDQIAKTRATRSTPSYMLVKACSEMLELFRDEAKSKLLELRQHKTNWVQYGSNVTPLPNPALEADFRKIYRAYWISMKAFHAFYEQALSEARKPKYSSFSHLQSPDMPLCQAIAA